ncbi:MAG: PAS domain S-box protein [Nodosilinea sp.]
MVEQLQGWLAGGGYMPHGTCYLWQPGLVWLHLLSDGLIALAYGLIAAALIHFVRQRQDLPFRPLFWLFGVFIAACGATHLLAIWTLWFPTYWLSGLVKAGTALVSLYTALTLLPLLPRALALPSTTQLANLNQALQTEISDHKQAQTNLRAAELNARRLNQELEDRVQRRTAELEQANQQIEALLTQEQQARLTLQAAKDDLQVTAERLNLALSAAQMGTWDWHLESHTQVWSPQAERLLGFTPGGALHAYETWLGRVHPDDREGAIALVSSALENKQEFSLQYRVIWPTGDVRWLTAYGRVVIAENGKAQRAVGVLQDITEHKQSELSLRDSATRFRAMFEQAAVGMARLSVEGCWIQVNQKLCEILGYPADELLHQSFRAVTWEEDKAQDEYYYNQLIRRETTACQFEKRYIHKAGHPIWTLVTVSIESDGPDGPTVFIAIIEDIEDRKAAQIELQHRANELSNTNQVLAHTTALLKRRNVELDQFAYVTSHDLKAPLRAIANLAEWISEDLAGQLPTENLRQLGLLQSRVQRMEALINGLLEYSRVGRRERTPTRVDVNQLLADVVDSLAPVEGFRVEVAPDMPTLTTYQTALGQVFANLISNALKHHHRDRGTVQITWQAQGRMVEFAVADDGPGIAPRYHDKIFTIFQTLKARDDFESTGIGLSVVKKIVEAENGRVWVASAVGQGTTFYFTWPFDREDVE